MPEHVTSDVTRWLDSLNLLPSEGCALMWVGGSRAYGLAGEDSDVDVRAVAFPTFSQLALMEDWGERHMPDADTVLRSARKTLMMMRNGNPNLIELYGLPDDCMLHADEWGSRLLEVGRQLMFTRKAASSFAGYAIQQKHLAERNEGAKRDKALMHSLRVWRMGAELMETGKVNVRRDRDGMELKAIRLGEYDPAWYETAWEEARTRFHAAEEHSTLPAPVTDAEYRELVEPLMSDWMRHLLKEEQRMLAITGMLAVSDTDPRIMLIDLDGGYHDNVNIRRKDGTINESIRRVVEDRHAMRADKFCWSLDVQRAHTGTDDRREETE